VPPSELGTPTSERGNARQLPEREFVVRAATGPEDVERVAALSGAIHGPGVAELTRALFLRHPNVELADLFFVEHVPSQQIVSTLCLIPWVLCIEGVGVRAGEMGIVGTLEPYRKRGLVRAQVKRFNRRLNERGCLVSHIQGIPYFYRQFGYEYALPLEGGLRLEMCDIPAEEAQTYRRRTGGVPQAYRRRTGGVPQAYRRRTASAAPCRMTYRTSRGCTATQLVTSRFAPLGTRPCGSIS
jgi:hypothetical protein